MNRVKLSMATSFSLILFYFSYSFAQSPRNESEAEKQGCRWNYKLQHDWLTPESGYAVLLNALAENCTMCCSYSFDNPPRNESEAEKQGCRWNYKLQHDWLTPESEYAKFVRAAALAEKCSR